MTQEFGIQTNNELGLSSKMKETCNIYLNATDEKPKNSIAKKVKY